MLVSREIEGKDEIALILRALLGVADGSSSVLLTLSTSML